jgi:galactose oxidase-like protein
MRSGIIGTIAFLFLLTISSNVGAGGFVSTGSMTTARAEHQAVLLNDGQVLLVGGGAPDRFGGDASAELYDPSTGMFTATGSMNIARFGATAVLLRDGRVLVYGGGVNCYYCGGEIYDPAIGTWTLTGSDLLRLDGFYQTGTLLDDGDVLTSGGWDLEDVGVSTWTERFDPTTGEFSFLSELSAPRYSSTSTLLRDGRVLIAGGDDWSDGGGGPLANVDVYNPQTMTVTAGPPMTTPRAYHTATLLKSGKVFIAGGSIEVSYGQALAHGTAEIFDPTANTFSPAGVMTDARMSHTATLLANGQVLIAGGGNTLVGVTGPPQDAIPYAELYNPTRRTFTRIASMLYARQSHQAVLLKNGDVLITGGYDQNHNRLATAELYEQQPSLRVP